MTTTRVTTRLKVGALAERTGLTVRALHHYDEIGLLEPAERTPSGHRLYGPDEVERLQRITSLRALGLGLDEISACLDRPGYDLEGVLALQMERVRDRIARSERLLETLASIRARLRAGEHLHLDDLTRSIRMTETHEKYFTPEQLEQLARRADTVGPERMEEVGREWERLYADFARAMEADLDPAAPEVQALARRHAELVAEFTGGDAGLHASLGEMYRAEGPDQVRERAGMAPLAPGLWEYVGRARAALAD